MRIRGAGHSAHVWPEVRQTEKYHFVAMQRTLLLFLGWSGLTTHWPLAQTKLLGKATDFSYPNLWARRTS